MSLLDGVLAEMTVERVLGSGSNGVVLLCELPGPGEDVLGIPRACPLAVKLVSHFWDDAALTLLSCERDVYTSIGQHPNIIRVYAQGMGEIPESMQELLPQEMTEAIAAGSTSTQFYIMDCAEDTLYSYRFRLPPPIPLPTLLQLAIDIVSGIHHLEGYGVVNMDLTLTNVLIKGSHALLSDFGIAVIVPVDPDTCDSDSGPGNPGWSCAYDDNFDTLINPFALSPDVLNGYYDAVSRYDADGSAPQYFSVKYQGVWSAGVLVYQLACGAHPLPTWPEDGIGVTDRTYDESTAIAPIPTCYPQELGDLLRCMLAYDPRHRCTTGQALSTLTSLQQSLGMGSPIVSDVLPDYCVDAHLTAALTRVTALLDDWSTSPDRPALLSAASAVSTCVGFSFTEDNAPTLFDDSIIQTAAVCAHLTNALSAEELSAYTAVLARSIRTISCALCPDVIAAVIRHNVLDTLLDIAPLSIGTPSEAAVFDDVANAFVNLTRFDDIFLEDLNMQGWARLLVRELTRLPQQSFFTKLVMPLHTATQSLSRLMGGFDGMVDQGLVEACEGCVCKITPSHEHVQEVLDSYCRLIHIDAYRPHAHPRTASAAVVLLIESDEAKCSQALTESCATALRNLSCIPNDESDPVNGCSAAILWDAQAPVVLDAALDRYPDSTVILDHVRCSMYNMLYMLATNRADLVARRSTVDAQPPLVPVSSLVEPAVETTTSTILLPELPRLELVLSGSVSIHDEPPRATPVANAPDTPSVAPPKLQDAKPSSHYSTAGTYMLIGACAGIVLGLGLPILFR